MVQLLFSDVTQCTIKQGWHDINGKVYQAIVHFH